MPTLKVQVSDYKALLPVAVSKSLDPNDSPKVYSLDPNDSPKVYEALLDTGAQVTFVSRRVVDQLAAHSVGQIMSRQQTDPPNPPTASVSISASC